MAKQLSEEAQLKGITIIIDSVDYADDEDTTPYSVIKIYHGDLEGPIKDFIERIENDPQVVEFEGLKAESN